MLRALLAMGALRLVAAVPGTFRLASCVSRLSRPIGPGVAKVKMMAKETLGNDSNGVGDTPQPCAEPVWRLPVHGARGRTLSRHPSRLLRALGGAFLPRTTAASLARCAIEQPHVAKKSPFARAGPNPTALPSQAQGPRSQPPQMR
jgi:hypothetical protein